MAVLEHAVHSGDVGGIKVRHVQAGQGFAIVEHEAHIDNVRGIKVCYIQAGQGFAMAEHGAHIGDVGGIKVRYIEAGQGFAILEHGAHGSNIASIYHIGASKCCQGRKSIKYERGIHIGVDFSSPITCNNNLRSSSICHHERILCRRRIPRFIFRPSRCIAIHKCDFSNGSFVCTTLVPCRVGG